VAKQNLKLLHHGRRVPSMDDFPTLAMHKSISIAAGSENAAKFVDKIKSNYLECTKEEVCFESISLDWIGLILMC
jgi:hypothetical protein